MPTACKKFLVALSNKELVVNISRLSELASSQPFDIVFIDAFKGDYPTYLQAILDLSPPGKAKRLLRKGGIIVADNVLRSALVVDNSPNNPASFKVPRESANWTEEEVERLDEFNKMMHGIDRIDCFLLPVFDGLGLGRLLD
jgi:predicted O-methyltransferase YrrM